MSAEGAALCAECGGVVGEVERCPKCGARREGARVAARREGAEVEAAWRVAERATWAFLSATLSLRALNAWESGWSARRDGGAAVLVTLVALAVAGAMRRRRVAVLASWAWLCAAGTGLAALMTGAVCTMEASMATRALAALNTLAVAAYARWLWRAKRAIE